MMTLFRLILGFIEPTEGKVAVGGEPDGLDTELGERGSGLSEGQA